METCLFAFQFRLIFLKSYIPLSEAIDLALVNSCNLDVFLKNHLIHHQQTSEPMEINSSESAGR